METCYVYILHSEKADKYYIGQTSDIQTRLLFHNQLAQHSFTARYRPWVLKLSIPTENRSIARKVEFYLKKRRSRQCLEQLIQDPETGRQTSCNAH